MMHRVIYRCNSDLKASHRTVLAFIFDRTIGWDKHYERITYDQFENGVWDSEQIQVAFGTRLSRKTISKCLEELISWGIVLRRIETGCKTGPKYFYAINLGYGVRVKNRDGQTFICKGLNYLDSVPNLFRSEKQHRPEEIFTVIETVFVDGQMTQVVSNHKGEQMPLAIPKRMRAAAPIEKTAEELAREEFGESVEKGNCPQCIEITTTGVPQWNRETENTQNPKDTEPNNTEAGGAFAPASASAPIEKLTQIVSQVESAHQQRHDATIEKETLSISELETVWKKEFFRIYDSHPVPWTGKTRGQVKNLQKKWIEMGRSRFGEALCKWIQQWDEIGVLFFSKREANESSYPSEPSIGYLTACFETYVRAYKHESLDDVPAMTDKEVFINRLRLRGWDDNKIEALVDKKFDSKKRDKPPAVDRQAWKAMIQGMNIRGTESGRFATGCTNESNTKKSEPDNVIPIERFKLEEWK